MKKNVCFFPLFSSTPFTYPPFFIQYKSLYQYTNPTCPKVFKVLINILIIWGHVLKKRPPKRTLRAPKKRLVHFVFGIR